MKNHELFLETYRKIEQALNKDSTTVQDYEEMLIKEGRKEDSDKLRFCRTTRNFLSHQSDAMSFISISDNMQTFLEYILYQLDVKSIPVRKKMVTMAKSLSETATVATAVTYLNKKKCVLPFFSKVGTLSGIFGYTQLAQIAETGKSFKTTKLSTFIPSICSADNTARKKNYICVSDKTAMSELDGIPKDVCVIVTAKDGSYLGFIPRV